MAETEAEPAVTESLGPERARPKWRTPLTLGLAVVLLVVAGGLVLRYRHDHRDEWVHTPHRWHHIEVSHDGRTLTFVAFPSMACYEPEGVHFGSDPTAGGTVTATLSMKIHVVVDGRTRFCPAALSLEPDRVPVTLDRPVPDGSVFIDSTTSGAPYGCPTPTRQVIGQPTTPATPYSCGP